MDDELARKKEQRLLQQWPKYCRCGREYQPADWLRLEAAYIHRDDYSTQSARHCHCKSTLVIDVEIHDIEAW